MQRETVKYRLCYSMIKLAQDEEEARGLTVRITYLYFVGIFPIYRAWLMNLLLSFWDKISSSLNFRDKIFFPYQILFLRGIRDLKAEKSTDKYIFSVFSAFMRLFIMNFLYTVGWWTRIFKILDELFRSKPLKICP